ncbi:hypothetical protein Xmau_02200 [Xenorhabdus mauleonii]|uniref:Uncharacterized protein n=1 Tax=Xenorhabdus mauleonii TaxID=351675 RepID=A0A1I3QCS8_9GAMM|nr:hypothetical protein [Xenorhabdus mauleonii]PHM40016.1 hypothetical protein Xmau_02200 [Xenorhabdus mauleonii]SFJ31369.1 hypothetical protein SAMN05421680_107108 [Xenorhabdus mauleonii]
MNRTYYIKKNIIETDAFSEVCPNVINEKLEKINKRDAKKIACLEIINDTECHFFNSLNTMRKFYLYLYFIASVIALGLFLNHYVKTWRAVEKSSLEGVFYAKKDHGEYFYLNPKLPEYQKKYEYIAHDNSISLLKYWHIRYSKDGFYGEEWAREFLLIDGGFFSLYLFFIIASLYFLCRVRSIPPFLIDREKQIFYTWSKGKVYAANYSQLEVYNSSGNLGLKTCGYDKDNNLINYFYSLKFPGVFDKMVDKDYLLVFIAKYFMQGKYSVSLVDYKRRKPFFRLREEPKPEDWELQVEKILTEVDRLGVPYVSASDKKSKDRV